MTFFLVHRNTPKCSHKSLTCLSLIKSDWNTRLKQKWHNKRGRGRIKQFYFIGAISFCSDKCSFILLYLAIKKELSKLWLVMLLVTSKFHLHCFVKKISKSANCFLLSKRALVSLLWTRRYWPLPPKPFLCMTSLYTLLVLILNSSSSQLLWVKIAEDILHT